MRVTGRLVPLLPLALAVQAALLLPRLGLLPTWGDEQFTLTVSGSPLARLLKIVAADYHPPLYYLAMHAWLGMARAGDEILTARLFSVLCALLATVVFDRLWLRALEPDRRMAILALWTFSPCLVLYARMARSYTLVLLIGLVALYASSELLRRPLSLRKQILYAVFAALLCYVHYLPGIALVVSVGGVIAWCLIRERDGRLLLPLVLTNLLIVVLYRPWLDELWRTLGRMEATRPYTISPHWIVEHGARLAYWFVSFNFGEALPPWTLVMAALVSPLVVWLLLCGVRRYRRELFLWVPIALVGYFGAWMAVIFAMVPARLLLLLPFYFLLLTACWDTRRRLARGVVCVLLAFSALGLASYYRRDGFLNKGYLIPFDELARLVDRQAPPGTVLVLVDALGIDCRTIADRMPPGVPVVRMRGPRAISAVEKHVARPELERIWEFRSTRDLSPARTPTRIESFLATGFVAKTSLYLPYTQPELALVRLLGWTEEPTHVFQVVEYHRARADVVSSTQTGPVAR